MFADVLCYADDFVSLALSPSAHRLMIRCCEDFAWYHDLKFSMSD